MKVNDKCVENEIIGRNYFMKLISKNTKIIKYNFGELFDNFDVIYETADTIVVCEIKVRNNKHDDYNGEWILEWDKYLNLILIRSKIINVNELIGIEKKVKIIYINYYTDNIYQIWDITNLDNNKVKNIKANICTSKSNSKTMKEVFYLKNIDAIKIGEYNKEYEIKNN